MKSAVTTCFIILISFATWGDTTAYVLKKLNDSSYSWVNNISSEEKGEEGEEVIKKTEAFETDGPFFQHDLITSYVAINNNDVMRDHIFPSSDFSEEVFFPPEAL